MKTISINIPCMNEEENILPLYNGLVKEFEEHLPNYQYQIQFIDNFSTDGTREKIKELCNMDTNVRAIFNVKNFGACSGYYGFLQTDGDCTISIAADFQEPIDLIHKFAAEWEKGACIVCGIKSYEKENKFMSIARTLYYKLLKSTSKINIIERFSGYGLYDQKFVHFLRTLDEPNPYIRTLVAEYGYNISLIPYIQENRKTGKTKNSLFSLFDVAVSSLVSNTKVGVRIASIGGFFGILLSFLLTIIYAAARVIIGNGYHINNAPLALIVLFLSSLQMLVSGILGEYILSVKSMILRKPYVIEQERINFKQE